MKIKVVHSFIIFIVFVFGCKKFNPEQKKAIFLQKNKTNNVFAKKEDILNDSLIGTYSLKNIINTIKTIKHTHNKHKDWMTNNNRNHFLADVLEIEVNNLSTKTTSYTFKDDYIFYLHTLSHKNDSISLRPYLKKSLGKYTEYLSNRVLIFSMKNNKEANFIDIPLKSGYSKIQNELIKRIYEKIDIVVLSCDSTQVCKLKDFRKK